MPIRSAGWLTRRSPVQVTSLGLALVVVIGFLDLATGYEISFSIFYLIPVAVVTWYADLWAGLILSLVCAAAWFGIETGSVHTYSNRIIPWWNASVRLGFFVITASLLAQTRRKYAREAALARTDSQTGLLNARAFRELVEYQLLLAGRSGSWSALGYIDVDDFKRINDRDGHAEGDRVLQAVALALTSNIRATDIASRVGGDEFAIYLPLTDAAAARVVCAKLHAALRAMAATNGWPIGFSMGVAVFSHGALGLDDAIKAADSLMYEVKTTRKNDLSIEEFDASDRH